jgi:predicted DNA-binding transcriptional regulator YafY
MSKRETLARHSIIIKKLKRHPSSFAEISETLAFESELQGYDYNISKRTFSRDINEIGSLYGTYIKYNASSKKYYIEMESDAEMNVRMLEAFDTFNLLNLTQRLSNQVHFEKRKPQGTDNLFGLLHAIKNKLLIKFTYQKYWSNADTVRKVEPYVLKEFKNRWYVLAKDLGDNNVKSFALDRITEMEISKKKFKTPAKYNVDEHYKYSFGIMSPNDDQPQEIILSFDPIQGKYAKSLPWHQSQEVLIDNENELRIKLTLYITHDFFMELLSHGNTVRVIQPRSLIEAMRKSCTSVLKMYD